MGEGRGAEEKKKGTLCSVLCRDRARQDRHYTRSDPANGRRTQETQDTQLAFGHHATGPSLSPEQLNGQQKPTKKTQRALHKNTTNLGSGAVVK